MYIDGEDVDVHPFQDEQTTIETRCTTNPELFFKEVKRYHILINCQDTKYSNLSLLHALFHIFVPRLSNKCEI
jgi:hypothetical protein